MTTSSIRAATLSIGDELMSGQCLDRHGRWFAEQLRGLGVRVVEHRVVPDDRAAIASAMADLTARAEWLLVTGGLGPTADDLTRESLGDVVTPGQDLEVDEAAEERLQRWLNSRGRQTSSSNLRQARRPVGSRMLDNPNGTAPGVAMTWNDCHIYLLPGPPREMYPMFDDIVRPAIQDASSGSVVRVATVHAYGLPEATAADRLGALLDRDHVPVVGITASEAIISARIVAEGTPDDAARVATSIADEVERRWQPYVYGRDGEALAAALGSILRERNLTLATAESCTGGLVGSLVVDVAGSSDYYAGGWVTYSNEMKMQCLGVPETLLAEHGAVSAEVAQAMARGAVVNAGADLAVSITGIAGPGGATDGKPVGTVHVGLARRACDAVTTSSRQFKFRGDRTTVRDRSAKGALQVVRLALLDEDAPLIWETPS